ncbi:hypothetical protein [Micromonospora sp. WMMD812]|uniref:hypothetical protein n=1 Tax=Micromonospora sp. WMMD812 TaxID=3015152 RepID=UPI00248BF342|nr:hypothetical protein [Micromonospora sp. WMMD812]WBB69510.1 hypothetical protein O7603_09220 [Micromonospora sp. WMMD812]
MGWLRDRFGRHEPPGDVAERLTGWSFFRVSGERVPVTDRETVQRWLRDLDPYQDQQVHVRRPWGVVAAVTDRRYPVGVVMADTEDRSWAAYPPGGDEHAELTPEQVEHVMLDALTSAQRPAWPDWRRLD